MRAARRRGREVRQRPAKPRTAVRFRSAPSRPGGSGTCSREAIVQQPGEIARAQDSASSRGSECRRQTALRRPTGRIPPTRPAPSLRVEHERADLPRRTGGERVDPAPENLLAGDEREQAEALLVEDECSRRKQHDEKRQRHGCRHARHRTRREPENRDQQRDDPESNGKERRRRGKRLDGCILSDLGHRSCQFSRLGALSAAERAARVRAPTSAYLVG
jgi:hypothetical protein